MNRLMLIIGGIVSVLLVAGAVFIGVRMLNAPGEGIAAAGGNMMMLSGSGGGQVAISLEIKPAPELPETEAAVNGLFVRREDNSIFVGTGEIEFSISVDQASGQRQANSSYSGPVLEVVVTRETLVYRDETKMPSPGAGAVSGNQTIQQVVKPVDSLDELGENTKNTSIQAWGNRSGDRVVAEVLVYQGLH